MDARDLATLYRSPWRRIDEKRMVGIVEIEFGDEEIEVPMCYDVCPLCNGKGSHVNPSIDAHGISAEEMYDDPDFAEDYFRGAYDQPCNECGGKRVVPVMDRERTPADIAAKVDEAVEDAHQYASERYHEMRLGY